MAERAHATWPQRNDLLLVVLALPLYFAAVGQYGWRVVASLAVSVAVGLLTEWAAKRIRGQSTRQWGVLHWVLIPLVLPPVAPYWLVGVATFSGSLLATAFFGGHGRQLASPVAVGWTFASLSFQAEMGFGWSLPFRYMRLGWSSYESALLTVEHPVDLLAVNPGVSWWTILEGDFPQPPGSAIPLVLIGCCLLALLVRAVDVRGAVAFLITLFSLSFVLHPLWPEQIPPMKSLLIGNVLLAAVFVLGDRRTSSRTFSGRWITGILAGGIALVIRAFASASGGVFFAVLFANVFSPLIDEGVLSAKYRRVEA